MKALPVVLLALLCCTSEAQFLAPEKNNDNYRVSGLCEVTVSRQTKKVYQYYISAPNPFKKNEKWYTQFDVDASSGKLVGGINSCNEGGWSVDRPAQYVLKTTEKYLVYTARCGGKNFPQDNVMRVVFDKSTGHIVYAYSDTKVSKNAFDRSNPKADSNGVKCNDDTKFIENEDVSSREQIEAVLSNSEQVQDFISSKAAQPAGEARIAPASATAP